MRLAKFMRLWSAACLIAVAFLSAVPIACGDDASPEEVVQSYFDGRATGDAEAVCALFSEDYIDDLLSPLAETYGLDPSATCEEIEAAILADPELRESGERSTVDGVEIDGDSATVSAVIPGGTASFFLVRNEGEWEIDSSVASGGGHVTSPPIRLCGDLTASGLTCNEAEAIIDRYRRAGEVAGFECTVSQEKRIFCESGKRFVRTARPERSEGQ
jgi:hypothetical protein